MKKIILILLFFPVFLYAQEKCGFVNGLQEGHCLFYYDNGNKKWDQHWKKGKLDGDYIAYFENGKEKAKGVYKRDKKVGIWVYYDEKGLKTGIEKYKGWKGNTYINDVETTYYKNEKVESVGRFLNDGQEGKWQSFYESGKLKGESTFVNGKREGESRSYDENGNLTKTENYKNGELVN
ncbi:hypothetical protein LZQ00_15315 [Sphingobacterium sp. SRCM116780]|uniref:toxin-antitoxin system YwqK family antitoxin n=1 Tax=Sphingobacterium sp. SRCM116780 TaxID=2907623 RepID=UPI001F452178|nr:hypothetical protein [Sphingobacterium sp. SRCM116780]UIR55626.1 hypothetical protein LZQ00_15315 [Sphingobacterium sp. SRCM116780]